MRVRPPEGTSFAIADDVCRVPTQGGVQFSASEGKPASRRLRFQSLLRNFLLRACSRVAATWENTAEWLLRISLCSHGDYLSDSAPTVSDGKPFFQTRCKMKSLPMDTLPHMEFSFTLCQDRKEQHLKNRPICSPRHMCKYR